MTTVVTKQPSETFAYTFDFTDRIGDSAVALSSIVALTATASGLVSGSAAVTKSGEIIDGQGVNVWLAGGTQDEDYVLLCKVTADNGETYELDGILRVLDASSYLVVEDGTGLAGANSYVTLAQADTYLRARDRATTWDALDAQTKAGRLIMATAYLDAAVQWAGEINTSIQALGWPRTGAVDKHGRALASNAVPTAVAHAVIEIAQAGDITTERSRAATVKTVGPITVEYASESDVSQGPGRYAFALALVSDLVRASAAGAIRLVRA